jgi:MFS family permease
MLVRLRRLIPPLLAENREFRRFWAGQIISLFGDQVTLLALPLVGVLLLHADARQMGYLLAVGLVPNLLFALHAGYWVDRNGRRRQVMIAADVGRAALLVTIPVASALGALTMAQLYVIAFLVGTLSVFFNVSYRTLFVSIVPRESYVEGNSILNGSRALSFVGGPSLGGLLMEFFSPAFTLIADAASFLASALSLGSIAPIEPPIEHEPAGHLAAGARFILRSAIIRSSLAATTTINFFNFVFAALFILYCTRALHVRPGTLGLVLGAGAVGAVVGSAVTGGLVQRIGIGPAFVLGCVLFPLPLVLVPLAAGSHVLVIGLLFAAEFGSGLGVMILDISAGSISSALVPDNLRGRVAGAHMVVNYGIRPVGALVGGVLGSAIGLRPTLWIATLGAIAGVLWLLPSPLLQLHTLDQTNRS